MFDITENFITVTIPLNKATKKKPQKMEEYVLNECDKKILNLIKENNYITVRELSGQIGFGMTTVTKHIRVLKEKGVIERRGSKKNGQWIVKEEVFLWIFYIETSRKAASIEAVQCFLQR